MFTGLVEGIGEIVKLRDLGGVRDLVIRSKLPAADLRAGDSVAVHGVCLTLTDDGDTTRETFRVQAVQETLRRSTLRGLRCGDRVHLERAVRAGDRLGGHLVQGHVDGVVRVRRRRRAKGEWILDVTVPPRWRRYLVEKGSVCLDGVSLTVGETGDDWFRVHLVPATAERTMLARYRVGREVNLEVDGIAKYVESLLGISTPPPGID